MEQFFPAASRSTRVLPIIQREKIKSNSVITIFKCYFSSPFLLIPAGRKGV